MYVKTSHRAIGKYMFTYSIFLLRTAFPYIGLVVSFTSITLNVWKLQVIASLDFYNVNTFRS